MVSAKAQRPRLRSLCNFCRILVRVLATRVVTSGVCSRERKLSASKGEIFVVKHDNGIGLIALNNPEWGVCSTLEIGHSSSSQVVKMSVKSNSMEEGSLSGSWVVVGLGQGG